MTDDEFVDERLARALERVTVAGRPEAVDPQTDKEWQKLSAAMAGGQSARHVGRMSWRGWPAAAVCVLVVAIGIRYIQSLSKSQNISIVPESYSYSTTTRQTATIHLVDGSRVTLAPVTKIRVSGRDVELDGEAVFTIVNNADDPFVVQAGGTVTKVLGTTFGIRAYDTNVRVAVSEGRVSVQESVLSKGDVATVAGNRVQVRHNVDVSSMISWASGRLVFDAIPLRELIPDLKRWYGIEVSVTDTAMLNSTITTTLEHEPVDEIISILAGTLHATAARNGSRVTFSPR